MNVMIENVSTTDLLQVNFANYNKTMRKLGKKWTLPDWATVNDIELEQSCFDEDYFFIIHYYSLSVYAYSATGTSPLLSAIQKQYILISTR